jgi:DNA-directed RNA polymerase specialized sigma24 family protein
MEVGLMTVHTAGDESFAEYVSMRWSMLYRLAVLLGGTARADDLTEAAMVRAYVSWRRVQEAVSADVAVKKILVSTAVSAGEKVSRVVESRSSRQPTDGDELWSRISALPPRERAVVVLLYYEDLSEAQVARMLGCSQGTVTALAFTALTTDIGLADFTTREVRDELALRADEAAIPPPPIGALVARGHRERRRRVRRAFTWPAAAVVVALVGVTVPTVVGGGDPDPPEPGAPPSPAPSSPALPGSLARLPDGAPPPESIAYVSRRTLHTNGREVALAGKPSAIAQGSGGVFVSYLTGTVVHVDTATGEVEPVTGAAAGPAITDPGGRYVAWPEVRAGQAAVVVRRVGADGPTASVEQQVFPGTARCCDNPFVLVGMTRSGAAIGSLPAVRRAWAWDRSDGRLREIAGLGESLVDQVVGEEIVAHEPPYRYTVGVLRDGVFVATNRFRARSVNFSDPLGRRIVYVDEDGETHVRERRSFRRGRAGANDIRLQLPVLDAGFASARWAGTGHVLLDVADDLVPDGALVRCDVVSGACEIAVRFDGPHLVAR